MFWLSTRCSYRPTIWYVFLLLLLTIDASGSALPIRGVKLQITGHTSYMLTHSYPPQQYGISVYILGIVCLNYT